jgi:hypothetical protein
MIMVKLMQDKILTADSKVDSRDSNFYSDFISKAVNQPDLIYNKWQDVTSVPQNLKMDFSRIIEKPFFVKNLEWSSTQQQGAIVGKISIPTDLLVNNLIKKPFESSCLYRFKICLYIQVSGTPLHQGVLISSSLPDVGAPSKLNQLLIAPHAFLNANESNPVCVEVPFYSSTVLRPTNQLATLPDTYDYASNYIMVVNPLLPSLNGTTTLTVSVQAVIKQAEFYVPRVFPNTYVDTFTGQSLMQDLLKECIGLGDRTSSDDDEYDLRFERNNSFSAQSAINTLYNIPTKIFDGLAQGAKSVMGDVVDAGRGAIRAYTGFHNPNSTAINDRMIPTNRNFGNNVDQPTLYEKLDQHAHFDRITYDYLFDTDQDEMDMKFILSKPVYISTFSVANADATGTRLFTHPITPYVEAFNADFTFYSPMRLFYESSLYWRGTIKMHIQSSMNNFQYCKLLVARNYSYPRDSSGQFLPMSETQNLMTDTLEFSAGGQIQTVELPYCSMLEQTRCFKDIEMNARAHGLVSIYLLQPLVSSGNSPSVIRFNVYFSAGDDFQFYGYANDCFQPLFAPASNFEAQSEVTVVPSEQHPVLNDKQDQETTHLRSLDFKPMVSVRDYIRRVVPIWGSKIDPSSPDSKTTVVSLSQLFKGDNDTISTNFLMRSMFYGFTGGLKIKVRAIGCSSMTIKYIPPDYFAGVAGNMEVWKSTTPLGDGDSGTYFRARENTNGLVLNSVLPSSTPFQEIPTNTIDARQKTDVFTKMVQSEFVIPNMSPFRFITYDDFIQGSEHYGPSAMGHIVMNFTPDSDDSAKASTIRIMIYAGFTDESRLGQHCFFRGAKVPTEGEEMAKIRTQSDYNQSGEEAWSNNGGPTIGVLERPGFYFYKS